MKTTLTFLLVLFTWAALPGQGDCPQLTTTVFLHGNRIKGAVETQGTLFGIQDRSPSYNSTVFGFQAPFDTEKEIGTIDWADLWISAKSPDGELQVAASDLWFLGNSKRFDFYPGPLDENGETYAEDCQNWNRIWEIRGQEIEAHIADWNDNGAIDHLIPAIILWPGRGNPFFSFYHGFELPDTPAGLAPFEDVNGDGIYTPLHGDYPRPETQQVIPSHMTWCIFNDKGNVHHNSNGNSLGMEIQLTTWALSCAGNPLLNETVFTSHKFINRSGETKVGMKAGLSVLFENGCYYDDLIGTDPKRNTVFVYSRDNTDCVYSGIGYTYGQNPPVQAFTFLNRELSSAFPLQDWDPFYVCPYHFISEANLAQEFDHYLNARTRYGEPISAISPDLGGTPLDTAFLFPDPPANAAGWSMYTSFPQFWDACLRYGLGNVDIGDLQPDSTFQMDVAWSFHRGEGLDFLQNTQYMAARIGQLQDEYQSGFQHFCTPLSMFCSPACVYPGDANADGIANYEDLLAIGLAMGQQGAAREENMLYWGPLPAEPWADDFFWGPNHHHADCNGDGQVEATDIELITLNYGKTRPGYEYEHTFPLGDQLKAVANSYPGVGRLDSLQPGDPVSIQVLLQNLPEDIYGLSFSMVWDPAWVRVLIAGGTCSAYPEYCQSYFKQSENYPPLPPIDFSITRTHLNEALKEGSVLGLYVKIPNELPGPPPPDGIRFRFRDVVALRADGSEVPIGAEDIVLTLAPLSASQEAGIWAGVRLSPNPVSDVLYLTGLPAGPVEWEWFDAQGISRGKGATESPELQLSVGFLADGLYFLSLKTATALVVKRVVVWR